VTFLGRKAWYEVGSCPTGEECSSSKLLEEGTKINRGEGMKGGGKKKKKGGGIRVGEAEGSSCRGSVGLL